MVKKPRMSRHHKKPRSHGGTNDPANLIMLPLRQHRAWHVLFHNFTPPQIAGIINAYFIEPNLELCCVSLISSVMMDIDYSKVVVPTSKHWKAWETLFGDAEIGTICALINESYLDPEFQFFVRLRR